MTHLVIFLFITKSLRLIIEFVWNLDYRIFMVKRTHDLRVVMPSLSLVSLASRHDNSRCAREKDQSR